MEFLVSSTADTVSNFDTDPDVTAFDTDLPAAHNVSAFFFIYPCEVCLAHSLPHHSFMHIAHEIHMFFFGLFSVFGRLGTGVGTQLFRTG